jgi:multiple sugar transport system permease protein
VSVLVVSITMLISVPAAFALSRMQFWGSASIATGVFLSYLVPGDDDLEFATLIPPIQVSRQLPFHRAKFRGRAET